MFTQRGSHALHSDEESEPQALYNMTLNVPEDRVYVRDAQYCWLPAIVLEMEPHRAKVRIDRPRDWKKTTVVTKGAAPIECSSGESPPKWITTNESSRSTPSHTASTDLERWVPLSDYYNHRMPLQNTVASCRDLAELQHLHEAAILYQIKERHCGLPSERVTAGKITSKDEGKKKKQRTSQPYTRVGEVVVAVNPCRWIPSLYTGEQQQFYVDNFTNSRTAAKALHNREKDFEEKKEDHSAVSSPMTISSTLAVGASEYDRLGCEPHVYEVSAMAFRGLTHDKSDQTILVSGESGSGKTETVKIILKHLATLRQGIPMKSDTQREDALVYHLLASSPIFEAFGNAKTVRNKNSSRFGKVTRLSYSLSVRETALVGSSFDTYLLETSRTVSHVSGERNFHIFYQMLAAPCETKEELLGADWSAATASDFLYLTNADNTYNSSNNDSTLWEQTIKALRAFGWAGPSLERLMRALGSILLIGNVQFDTKGESESCIASQADLNMLAKSLGIPASTLGLALVQRTIKTAQDTFSVPHTVDQAKTSSDALAKALYYCVFSSLVRQINIMTSVSPSVTGTCKTIALVDIFGFESFHVNRFEQLCINYANERLQQKYVLHTLHRHKVEYEAEGIELPDWKNIDNSRTVELFESPSGILNTLCEQCVRPNGNNEVFVFKLKQSNKNHASLIHQKIQDRTEFGVRHFAGEVIYDASSFVQRNTDKLPDSLISAVSQSTNDLVAQELSELLYGASHIPSSKKKSCTVIEKFRDQLKSLLVSIDNSQTRYIRCIKPCEDIGIANKIDHKTVLRQLKCAGLLTAVELSRETFPNKLPFLTVERRFSCLLPRSLICSIKDMLLHDKAQLMMSSLFAPLIEQYRDSDFAMPFACGHTKVFFRAGALETLETMRQKVFKSAAIRVQQTARRVTAVQKFVVVKRGCTTLQATFRCTRMVRDYRRMKYSATKIQSLVRKRGYERKFGEVKVATRIIQDRFHTSLVRQKYMRTRQASGTVAAWTRMIQERRRFCTLLRAVTLVQATVRARRQRITFEQTKLASSVVSRFLKTKIARREYLQCLNAASVLALWCRNRIARIKYNQLKDEALMRQRAERLLGASLTITRWCRAKVQRLRFVHAVSCVTLIATNQRSRCARHRYASLKRSTATVQRKRRAQLQKRELSKRISAALIMQVCVRRFQQNAKILLEQQQTHAAVRLQICVRRMQLRTSSAMKIQSWTRQCQSMKKCQLMRERGAAARTLQLFFLDRQSKFSSERMQVAAVFTIQSWVRKCQKETKCQIAASKVQALVRKVQGAKAAHEALRCSLAATRLQSHFRSCQKRKKYVNDVRNFRASEATKRTLRHSIAATRLQSCARSYQQQKKYEKLQRDALVPNKPVASETSRDDRITQLRKPSELATMQPQTNTDVRIPSEVLKELEFYKKRVKELSTEVVNVTAESEEHAQEMEADFEERLSEYEEEVLLLKQTIECYDIEKMNLKDEIISNADSVRNLKTGIHTMQNSHRTYLSKVMRAIEKANAEHQYTLEGMKKERDNEVAKLKAEVQQLKSERSKFQPTSYEKKQEDVTRLARKLEKLIAPDYITAMTEKSHLQSTPMVDFVEAKVSSKARKIIYRLEDLARVSNKKTNEEESIMQGLQQQLVNAYEEIEMLQGEVGK